MNIIAGKYKGRLLTSLRDKSIRPATGRARQMIFDMLTHRMDLEGAEVLDLFAGTGSLGLEAISRGAASVVFVDQSRQSLAVLEKNIKSLQCESQCTLYSANVFWVLKNLRRSFDLVFVDPPYRLESIETLPAALGSSGVLRPDAYVVMEHSKASTMEFPEGSFEVLRKTIGQTVILIMRHIGMKNENQPQAQKETS
jgi:16S rRNA (guanine966-N2)-methyltransferase